MNLKESWKKFTDKCIGNVAPQIDATEFQTDEIKRYKIIFWGLVQGVGFRYEVWTIAQKLGLTGYVENLPDETVYAEIQGQQNKVDYLIEYLKSISKIHIERIQMDEIALQNETGFEIAN